MGENCSRGMKGLAEGHRGKMGVYQHTQNHNHKTFHFTLITLLRNRTKAQRPGIILQHRSHPHHYNLKDGPDQIKFACLQELQSRTSEFLKSPDPFLFYLQVVTTAP